MMHAHVWTSGARIHAGGACADESPAAGVVSAHLQVIDFMVCIGCTGKCNPLRPPPISPSVPSVSSDRHPCTGCWGPDSQAQLMWPEPLSSCSPAEYRWASAPALHWLPGAGQLLELPPGKRRVWGPSPRDLAPMPQCMLRLHYRHVARCTVQTLNPKLWGTTGRLMAGSLRSMHGRCGRAGRAAGPLACKAAADPALAY